MDVYRIGVSIIATNGVSPVLAAISRGLTGVNTQVAQIGSGMGAWGVALGGVAAILGGGAIIKGLIAIGKHGGEVNHQLNLMKTAGMTIAESQESVAQAMKTSNNVLTTTLSENLKHIRELRYAFGETTTAIAHLDEISKANSILNNVRGGGKDQVWELVKALEMKGLTYKPEEFSSYVDTMTKVVQATGGKVTPEMFMSTFKYGRTSMLGWDEQFVGGALPRLIQSMSSGGGGGGGGTGGPGNALMSAFAKVVQGQMSKTSAEEFERLGLGSAKHIKGSSESQLSGMKGRDLFMTNPYEWVQQILVPAMAAKGVTSQNDIIAQVSKLFPVRTAGQVISEMALQGRAFEGAASPFEKDIKLQKLPTGMPAYDELIKNDYPMVIQAFNQQWKNLLETLGSPMMAPGGSVITSMAALTSMMGSIAQFAGENSDRIKGFAGFIKELVSSGVSMLTFLANISNIGAVFELFGKIPWGTITTGLETVRSALASLAEWITNLAGMISGGAKGLFAPKSLDNSTKDFSDALKQQQSFRFDPGTSKTKVTPISLSLNVDGRTLAQTMSEQLEYLHEHATSAPSYDGSRKFIPADGGMMGT